jgi:hypothetical protein
LELGQPDARMDELIAQEGGDKLPTIDFVVKIARIFQVTMDVLLLDELDLPSVLPESVSTPTLSEADTSQLNDQ